MKLRRIISAALVGLALAAGSGANADILNVRALTSDADLTTGANINYLLAINFGQNATSFTANGINFEGKNIGGSFSNPNGLGASYSLVSRSYPDLFENGGNTSSSLPDGNQLNNLLKGMLHSGYSGYYGEERLAVGGLEIGKTYTMSLIARNWGNVAGNRTMALSYDANADGIGDSFTVGTGGHGAGSTVTSYNFEEDNPTASWTATGLTTTSPYLVEYTFVAASETMNMFLTEPGTNNSWHMYGFSLYEDNNIAKQNISTNGIRNGSFETDPSLTKGADHSVHGYAFDKRIGLISGWNSSTLNSIGLAPTFQTSNAKGKGNIVCQDFLAGSFTVPDGDQVLFMQKEANISQTVTGLEAGQDYILSWYSGNRAGQSAAQYEVLAGGTASPTRSGSLFANTFQYNTLKFTATGTETEVGFNAHSWAGLDTSLLLDNVQLTKASDYVAPNVSGWTSSKWSNAAEAGISTDKQYTNAVRLHTNAANVNGVEFSTITSSQGKSGVSVQAETGNFSMTAVKGSNMSMHGTQPTDYISDDAKSLVNGGFTYTIGQAVFNGLEPGATYETTLYFATFDGGYNTARSGTFTANNSDTSGTLYYGNAGQAAGYGGMVRWTGTATDEGYIKIDLTNLNSGFNMHMHASTNSLVSAAPAGYNDNIIIKSQFSGADNTAVIGTSPETLADSQAGITWTSRGYGDKSTIQSNTFQTGYNTGIALDFNEQTVGSMVISADVKIGTLVGNDLNCIRGVGIGFYDNYNGNIDGGEVVRGFSGIVLMPDGSLLYANNGQNNTAVAVDMEELTRYDYNGNAQFSNDAWYNLALEVEMMDFNSKAKIISATVNGNEYAQLAGKILNTTDLVGLSASTAENPAYAGYADNFQVRALSYRTADDIQAERVQYSLDNPTLLAETRFLSPASSIIGVEMDIVDNFSTPRLWKTRGHNDSGLTPNITNGNLVIPNNQSAMFDLDTSNKYGMSFSVDFSLNNLKTGNDGGLALYNLGIGFYDSELGNDGYNGSIFVDRGFTGFIINDQGALKFYSNPSDTTMTGTSSDSISWAGSTFNKNDFYTLTMDVEFSDDKAFLTGLSIDGSDADYSSLLGSEFFTTDMFGMFARSAENWSYSGFIDGVRVSSLVPEPSTYLMLILGIGGLALLRRKRQSNKA